MTLDAFFYPHKVRVRALTSNGSRGPQHVPLAAAKTVKAEVLDEQTLVRNADGEEVVSSANVTVPLATVVPLGSLVEVWRGKPQARWATVLQVERNENTAPMPSHLVLSLE